MISGGNNEGVRKRLERLGVQNVYLGVGNKKDVYLKFLSANDLKNDETVYMGDDLPDAALFKKVGFSASVPDAPENIKLAADYVSEKAGGKGAVREIVELILKVKKEYA